MVAAGLVSAACDLVFPYLLLRLARRSGKVLHRRTLVRSAELALKVYRFVLLALVGLVLVAFVLVVFLSGSGPLGLFLLGAAGFAVVIAALMFTVLMFKSAVGGRLGLRRSPAQTTPSPSSQPSLDVVMAAGNVGACVPWCLRAWEQVSRHPASRTQHSAPGTRYFFAAFFFALALGLMGLRPRASGVRRVRSFSGRSIRPPSRADL